MSRADVRCDSGTQEAALTKEELESELAEIVKQEAQALSTLNALNGARQMLTALIAKIDAKAAEAAQ